MSDASHRSDDGLPLGPRKQALLDRMEALIGELQEVTFVVPDESGYFSIEDELVQKVRILLERTLDLARDVTDLYDAEEPDEDTTVLVESTGGEEDVLKEIGAAISSELASQEVANMAFVARTQLTENYDALCTAMDHGFIWVVASNADTGLRRAGKALLTLETTIREYERLPPKERRWTDLKDSLEIRRVYGQFRRFVLRAADDPRGEVLERHLRSASHRIALLRDLKIYPFLRIYDRVPIRKLQKRILGWLERDESLEAKEKAGRELWSDLVSFAELLAQINQREELREHDRRTLRRVHQLLFESRRTPKELLPGHLEDLETLLGRDAELDRIILDPKSHRPEELKAPIERILAELEQPYTPSHDALEGFEVAGVSTETPAPGHPTPEK